ELGLLAVDLDSLRVERLGHALDDEGVGGGEGRERPGLRADVADRDVAHLARPAAASAAGGLGLLARGQSERQGTARGQLEERTAIDTSECHDTPPRDASRTISETIVGDGLVALVR